MERRWNAKAKQNFTSNSVRSFRKIQSIYFSMLFSLAAYLALWLRPIPVRPGEMKQADALARTLLFVRRVDRLDFFDSKDNIPSAYHYPSLFAGGFKSDKLSPDRSFVNRCSLRSHWAAWVCGFVPDKFPPALIEFDARFQTLMVELNPRRMAESNL
jgi:hypothetical protein